MRLKEKVIIVTASTRGIGWAIVQACAKEGAIVYMAVRRVEDAREQVKDRNKEGEIIKAVYCDASKPETYGSMIKEVVRNEGRLDVLINNFGTSHPAVDKDIENTSYEDFISTVDSNLASVFMTSQQAIRAMKNNGGGSIINISSIGGSVPDISQIAYGTSKAAINYLTRLIVVQAAKYNVRCNAILPGMIATDAVAQNLSEEFKRFFIRHIPLGRMGRPDEIAALAVYFAGDESAYTTGQIVEVSGGFGIPTPVYGDMAHSDTKR